MDKPIGIWRGLGVCEIPRCYEDRIKLFAAIVMLPHWYLLTKQLCHAILLTVLIYIINI